MLFVSLSAVATSLFFLARWFPTTNLQTASSNFSSFAPVQFSRSSASLARPSAHRSPTGPSRFRRQTTMVQRRQVRGPASRSGRALARAKIPRTRGTCTANWSIWTTKSKRTSVTPPPALLPLDLIYVVSSSIVNHINTFIKGAAQFDLRCQSFHQPSIYFHTLSKESRLGLVCAVTSSIVVHYARLHTSVDKSCSARQSQRHFFNHLKWRSRE